MDPNEALKLLRQLMDRLTEGADEGTLDHDDVGFTVETWEGLDKWLSNSGFFPSEWVKERVDPAAVLRKLVVSFKSSSNLQRVEGRPEQAHHLTLKAHALEYAIKVIEGDEPIPGTGQ